MICRQCLRSLQRQSTIRTRSRIFPSIYPSRNHASTTSPPELPASTTISDANSTTTPRPSAAVTPKSSVPAGTVLRGLNFLKGKQDPLALDDAEYPAWLWTILDRQAVRKSSTSANDPSTTGADPFSKSKKERRVAARAQRKLDALPPEPPKIAIYEQSADLRAGGDGSFEARKEAFEARAESNRGLRGKRRATIKEDNFLRGMK